jgi:beta-mannosidase
MPGRLHIWIWLILAVFCSPLLRPASLNSQTLCRTLDKGWEFRQVGTDEWLPAQVPGTVQTDLMAAGKIPDPYSRMNAHTLDWVEKAEWEYRYILNLNPDEKKSSRQYLVLNGLDTYAQLRLNRHSLLQSDNMFRGYAIDIQDRLVGYDTLYISFSAPHHRADGLARTRPYRLPADSDQGWQQHSVYTRKAGYQFGWDFAPRIVTMGIWQPIELLTFETVSIVNCFITTQSITPQAAHMKADIDVSFNSYLPSYKFVLELDGHVVAEHVRTPSEQTRPNITFDIPRPQLWWPNGYGQPHMYQLLVRIVDVVDGHEIDRKTIPFGVRTIQLVQDADSIGRSFYFRVNGRPIFAKGANYVPGDLFLPRARPRLHELFSAMTATHMNMVRVWGGGAYPDDAFYTACDSLGILVWQDFMFAGGMYPLYDPDFYQNVIAEVTNQIRLLRQHPSLALWCGNNEMDVAWHNWGWQQKYKLHGADSAEVWDSYLRLFEQDIPRIIQLGSPGTSYLPSSPISNWGKPEYLRSGNQHDWEVWHGGAPTDVYATRAARFVTEYGFQSYPTMATLAPYTLPEDRVMDSPWMRDRQKSYKGNAPILDEIRRQFGEPRDFEAFLVLSQLAQSQAMALAIKAQRTCRPHCMGTLYWQLNDCWPGPSWSTVDYLGNWKAAHYALQRLYAPVLLSVTQDGDDVVARIASDLHTPHTGRLHLSLKSFGGRHLRDHEMAVTLMPDSAWEAFRMPLKAFKRHFAPATTVLEAKLSVDGTCLASDHHYFSPAPRQRLPAPSLTYTVAAAGDHYVLRLKAKRLMRAVEIMVEGLETRLSDNYIDLLPGNSYQIDLYPSTATDPVALRERLRFRDLTQRLK